MSSVFPHVVAWYDARAEEYTDKISRAAPDGDILAFADALPAGKEPVLDWGAGPGNTAAHLIAMDIDTQATDVSPEMARIAGMLGLKMRLEPFEAIEDVPTYRGIYSNFALCHAPRDMLEDLVARAAQALVGGGVLHLALNTDGPDLLQDGAYFAYQPDSDRIRGAVRAAGLEILRERAGQNRFIDGTMLDFLIVLARKPA